MNQVDSEEFIRFVSISRVLMLIIRASMDFFELVLDCSLAFFINHAIAFYYDARVPILIVLESEIIKLHLIDLVHQVTSF